MGGQHVGVRGSHSGQVQERLVIGPGEQGRQVVAAEVDVRDADALARAVVDGARQLGGVDVVLANAGIGITEKTEPHRAFRDQFDVNLVGVWNTVHAATPLMIAQGAVVPLSSPVRPSGSPGAAATARAAPTATSPASTASSG